MEGEVRQLIEATAHCPFQCDRCSRKIRTGTPYLRVIVRKPDDDGVLHEVRRYLCCEWCRHLEHEENKS